MNAAEIRKALGSFSRFIHTRRREDNTDAEITAMGNTSLILRGLAFQTSEIEVNLDPASFAALLEHPRHKISAPWASKLDTPQGEVDSARIRAIEFGGYTFQITNAKLDAKDFYIREGLSFGYQTPESIRDWRAHTSRIEDLYYLDDVCHQLDNSWNPGDFAVVLDTETTGLKNAQFIEVGMAVVKSLEPFACGPIWAQLYKPSIPIEYGAMATHHIRERDVADAPPNTSFVLPECVTYIIGHGVDFDWNILGKPNVRLIDTLPFSRKLWPDVSHKLGALAYMLEATTGRPLTNSFHRAAGDVQMTIYLLEEIVRRTGLISMEALWEQSQINSIPTHMPFGKYKGNPIEEVPSDYMEYLIKDGLDNAPLVAVFQRILKERQSACPE